MNGEDNKFCPFCGEKNPASAEFCAKCGKKQPSTSTDMTSNNQVKDNVGTAHINNRPSLFTKWWFWTIMVAAVVAVIALGFGADRLLQHNRSPKSIAASIQRELRQESEDYGKAKVSWHSENGTMQVSLPENSKVVDGLKYDNLAIWNALIRDLKEQSKNISMHNNPKYSYIEVMQPENHEYVWLQIDKGKVKYNQADNY